MNLRRVVTGRTFLVFLSEIPHILLKTEGPSKRNIDITTSESVTEGSTSFPLKPYPPGRTLETSLSCGRGDGRST